MKAPITLFALAIALAPAAQSAVLLTAGLVAPAVGVDDQASLNDLAAIPGGTFNSQAFSDNAGPPGQSFTTGSAANYTLTAFSYKGAATGSGNYGGFTGATWGIRVSSVAGVDLTPIATITGIAHPTGTINGNEWFTWSFSGTDLLVLNGSTTYSFEAYSTVGYLGFDASDTTTAYAGGTAFNTTSPARTFNTTILQDRLYDRTFIANLAVVPEPSALVLVAGLGLLHCGRRRR
ncbi:MAG: hypothetical protein V4675_24425 [Verrucomicrobiota bacterium]